MAISLFEKMAQIVRDNTDRIVTQNQDALCDADHKQLYFYAVYVQNCLSIAESPMKFYQWIELGMPTKNH